MLDSIKNSNGQGKIFYGMHFCAGLAEYQEPNEKPYRVYLNENTIRKMDPSFAGRPIFVEHVDEVEPDIDTLKAEADGWVIESFYNVSDGKHWAKFIIVSERAERAIKNGMRLSNAYIPKKMASGGLWNGLTYDQEITEAEYEHLAIVSNPRYEESVIMTPEAFKKYNEDKLVELKKLSNSKKGSKMKFSFFKRTKVENAIESDMEIILPKTGKAVTLEMLVNAYEKKEDPAMGNKKNVEAGESAKSHAMANMDHMVKMHDGSYMKLKDMMSKHKDMYDELEEMKKGKKEDSAEKELDLKVEPSEVDAEGDLHNDPDSEHDLDKHEMEVAKEEHEKEMKDDLEHPEDVVHDAEDPEKDMDAKKKALQLVEHEEEELEEAKKKNLKKKNDLLKAAKLKNANEAHLRALQAESAPVLELSYDLVARGQQRYGS